MALILIDGFDHYTLAQLPDKENTISSVLIGSTYARFSGQGLFLDSSNDFFTKDIGINKSTIYFGTAIKKHEGLAPLYSFTYPLISIIDEASVLQVSLHITPSYQINVRRGDGTDLGSTSDNAIPNQKWFYLEGKIVISDTVGVVEVKVNETQVLNLTSQDTKYGSDYIRNIRFKCVYGGLDTYYDDFYVDDAQYHGDCRVRTFMPDLDGNSADFTRSTGSNDYECVDEAQSNEDTDYISSNTLNHKSIFGITTGALGTVKGIQVNNHCRVDEAGVRKIKPIVRSNATDYQGTETAEISADYIFEHDIWELDPDDSGAWTQTKLEAAEFGLEITT